MRLRPSAAIILSCLLVTSICLPEVARGGLFDNLDGSEGIPNPKTTTWINDDKKWFEISPDEVFDVNIPRMCSGLFSEKPCILPEGVNDVLSIKEESDFVVVLTTNGSVRAWGNNDHGQGNVPPTLTTGVQIATTSDTGAVLQKNGSVTVWGSNDNRLAAVPPILANNVSYITGGKSHFVALTRDGNVVAWGDNTFNQCNIPQGTGKIRKIAVGDYHTLALSENGSVFAWGRNVRGPCDIPSDLSKVHDIIAGRDFSLLRLENGTVFLCGSLGTSSAGSLEPGLYSQIANHNRDTPDAGAQENIAISESGHVVANWTWATKTFDPRPPEKPQFIVQVSSRGVYNLKRVCDKDLLSHQNRSSIYEKIYDNPGVHFNDLCRILGINRGTLSYNLAVLLISKKIIGLEYAGKTVYFSSECCVGDLDRILLIHMKNPVKMKLLQSLHIHGPLSRGDLLDVSQSPVATAALHLKVLADEGIVQIKKTGRKAYYSLHPEIAPHLSGMMTAIIRKGFYRNIRTEGELNSHYRPQ